MQTTENTDNIDSLKGNNNYSSQEAYFRDKIILISIFMGICVVYQHVKFDRTFSPAINEIHDFAFYIRKTCVPMFFAISGYLFFRGFTFGKLTKKLRRRVDTLLFPYLIWNILYVAFMIIMFNLGLSRDLTLDATSGTSITKAILNAECSPLWFLRYLMLFVCMAPLAYFVLRYRVLGGLLIMLMMAFNVYNYTHGAFDDGINVNSNTLVVFNYQFIFFATGAYGALCWSRQIEKPTSIKSKIAVLGVLILFIIYWLYLRLNGTAITNHLFRLIWIPIFWFAFDILPKIRVRPWMKFSFFIYCSHMFVLYCIQGTTAKLYSHLGDYKSYFALVEYIVLGLLTVWGLIKFISHLKVTVPKLFSLITGSRG